MRHQSALWRRGLLWLVLSVALATLLEGLQLLGEPAFSWGRLAPRWLFAAGLLVVARWTEPYSVRGPLYVWPWPGIVALSVGGVAALAYATGWAAWAAWVVLGAAYLLLLGLDSVLVSRRSALWRWGGRGLLAVVAGVAPVATAQMESHFAEEEFFVLVQALVLAIFWVLLLVAGRLLSPWNPMSARRGLRFDRRWFTLPLILLAFAGLGVTVRAYQRSFYPPEAPAYEGVSRATPFLCGEVQPDPQTFDGEAIFHRLLARVEANPRKGPPEYGMLALGSGDERWAEAFRESLLGEAGEGRYTDPAQSVKSVQYEAALRAYYMPRVHTAFPNLFSDEELALLREWFAAVNRRALTIEWVDWMYALAFTRWPEGPYENQENGAGLLALLESQGLAAPDLSPLNRDYLRRNRRGWTARFRNTDDAFIYQLEWINNAYFQSLYTGEARNNENVRLAFDWLLLQALADGAPLRYNHPARPSLAGIAYLGARLLDDPRYVWLAGRALEEAEAQGRYLSAQPGVEQSVSVTGRSPAKGSCLLYGDSGLPNQVGPLAPDKIVFRDGWSESSTYLLLNLRFTGWHRYKATNAVTLVYQDGPLAAEAVDGESFNWLPTGRSLFRDKRVPRENLNGLLVERTGMSAVLHTLTGLGSPWAQDPSYYAEVIDFETGEELDWAHTRVADWRRWQHDRWVYSYHEGGPVVVVDEAEGPPNSQAALVWHLIGKGIVQGRRVRLGGRDEPAEVVFIPVGSEGRLEVREDDTGDPGMRVVYDPPADGEMRLVTLFLPGQWAGARASLDREQETLRITRGPSCVILPLRMGE